MKQTLVEFMQSMLEDRLRSSRYCMEMSAKFSGDRSWRDRADALAREAKEWQEAIEALLPSSSR